MAEENESAKSEAEVTGEKEPVKEAGDLESIQKALSEIKDKAEANLAGWQRAQADFMNYKRRCEQEKEEAGKSANAGLLLKILPLIDDLEMALANVPPELAEQQWVDGIRLICRKWMTCLESQGVVPIKSTGEKFDPRVHEAIKQDNGEDGMVITEVQKGYTLGDKVLRPSKVIVGNGEKEPEP